MALFQDMMNSLPMASPTGESEEERRRRLALQSPVAQQPGGTFTPPPVPSPYAQASQPAAQPQPTAPSSSAPAQKPAQPMQQSAPSMPPPPPPPAYFAPVSFGAGTSIPNGEGKGGGTPQPSIPNIPGNIGDPIWGGSGGGIGSPSVEPGTPSIPGDIGDPTWPGTPPGPIGQPGGPPGNDGQFDLRQWIIDWFRSQQGGNPFQYENTGDESRWDTGLAKDLYESQSKLLGEDFDEIRRQTNESANSRGMFYSTPTTGRLGDIGVQQSRALGDLSLGIQREAANTYAQDRDSAFGRQAGAWGMNEEQRRFKVQEQMQRLAAMMGFDQQSWNQQMDLQGVGNQQEQQWLQMIMMLLGLS